MKDIEIKKILKKIISESIDQSLVNSIIKKINKATSQYGWTLGAGTDEDSYLSAIQEIPDFDTANAINQKFNLRNSIDDEFNFDKDDDWEYVTKIFQHMESIGVKVVNPNDQDTFNFDFSKNRLQTTPVKTDDNTQGGGTPEKEQDVVVQTGKCKPAPSLSSICSGKAYLKNCMKGVKGSKDDAVYKVQDFLIKKGFTKISKTGEIDSIYGPLTKEMVIQYQKSVNIKPDGIAGPQTISTMGICTSAPVIDDSSDGNTIIYPPYIPDDNSQNIPVIDGGNEEVTVEQNNCIPKDKKVIRAYNKIKEGMESEDPSFLRRECRILIDYQFDQKAHCDNLEELICFCGTKASSGDDGYIFMGDRKDNLKKYVSLYCKTDFVQGAQNQSTITNNPNNPIVPGCQTPGSVIAILQEEPEKLSKDDCKILFREAVNWYDSYKKCERGKHSPNPAYKEHCFSCLNRYNFNWKDLGSGENKVMKMYNFNKREINKKQRRELPRMESVEALNTALLYMKYDMKKTLTENKNNLKK